MSCRCPAKTWQARATAPSTTPAPEPPLPRALQAQTTSGTLTRALIMLVWTRWAQTNPPRPKTAAPVSAPAGPTCRRSQPYVPAPVSQTERTVSRLNACQVGSQGYSRYFSGCR